MAVDDEKFTRLWNSGASVKVIAQEFGWSSPSSVLHHRDRLDLPPRRRGRPGKGSEFDASFALTGGRWVPGARGVQHWVAD